jgi:hypothetical protein
MLHCHANVGDHWREQCGGIGSGVKGLVSLGELFQISDGGCRGSGMAGGRWRLGPAVRSWCDGW